MTRPSLAGIEQRAAAATEGPWDVLGGGEYVSGPDIVVAPDDGGVTPADATFIAAARTDVPALLAAVRDVLALHARVADEPALIDEPPRHDHARDCCDADGETWPCDTVRALATHLDLTGPEGDLT